MFDVLLRGMYQRTPKGPAVPAAPRYQAWRNGKRPRGTRSKDGLLVVAGCEGGREGEREGGLFIR
jgi:hypothetical protein